MERKEASEQLAKLVSEFEVALQAAQDFADEHNLYFRLDPAYGMGGTYDGEVQEWYASSQSC